MQTKVLFLGGLCLVARIAEANEPQLCFAPEYDTTSEASAISTPHANSGGSGSGSGSGGQGSSGSGLSWYDNYEPVLNGPYQSWGGGAAIGHGNDKFKLHLSIGCYTPTPTGDSNTKAGGPPAWSSQTTTATHGPAPQGYPGNPPSQGPHSSHGKAYSSFSPPTPSQAASSNHYKSPPHSSYGGPVPSHSYSSARPSSTSCVNSPTDRQCWGQYDINTDYNDITPDTGVNREVRC